MTEAITASYKLHVQSHLQQLTQTVKFLLCENSPYETIHTQEATRYAVFLGEYEQYLATSHTAAVKIWNLDRGTVAYTLRENNDTVYRMLKIGNDYLACKTKFKFEVIVYNWKTREIVFNIHHADYEFAWLGFSDKYFLCTDDNTHVLFLHNLIDNKTEKQEEIFDVTSLTYFTLNRFLSCHQFGTINVWDLDSFCVIYSIPSTRFISGMEVHIDLISHSMILQTENWFFTKNYLWDVERGRVIDYYDNALGRCVYLAQGYAIGINKHDELCIWHVEKEDILFLLKMGSVFNNQIALARESGKMVIATDASYIRMYQVFKPEKTIMFHKKLFRCPFRDIQIKFY